MTQPATTYEIKLHDTLWSIASALLGSGATGDEIRAKIADLQAWNPGLIPTALPVGKVINIAPPNPLQAKLDEALAEITRLQATIAGQQTSLAAAAEQHQADLATIAQLEAELEQRPPAPQPAPEPEPDEPEILWGINVAFDTEEDPGNLADREEEFAPVDAVRVYWPQKKKGVKSTVRYPNDADFGSPIGDRVVFTSYKMWPQDLLAGMYDADIVQLGKDAPKDKLSVHIPWHEMEDDVARGNFTAQQYRDAVVRFAQLLRSSGNPMVRVGIAMMGYTWIKGSKRNPEDYLPPDDSWDLLTTDTYFAGTIGQGVDTIPTAFDAQIATAAAHGKPWGITETGVGRNVSGQARKDALRLLSSTIRKKLLSQPVRTLLVGLYFVMDDAGDQWGVTADEWAAYVEGQSAA